MLDKIRRQKRQPSSVNSQKVGAEAPGAVAAYISFSPGSPAWPKITMAMYPLQLS